MKIIDSYFNSNCGEIFNIILTVLILIKSKHQTNNQHVISIHNLIYRIPIMSNTEQQWTTIINTTIQASIENTRIALQIFSARKENTSH